MSNDHSDDREVKGMNNVNEMRNGWSTEMIGARIIFADTFVYIVAELVSK